MTTITAQTNPFNNSRVDTPFQTHSDLKEIFYDEFERLTSIISEIKNDDVNHQSKGAIVTGDPGTGKTHLMMRLAKVRLKHNRLLFIRQPNNLNSVLYHIYSRVLESFVEKVPNSAYSQLEHLLATSFFKIIQDTFLEGRQEKSAGILFDYFRKLTDKDKYLVNLLSIDPINLYQKLGQDGARSKREYWQRIETMTDDWWKRNHGDVGYSTLILKGIIKFCSYSDPYKKKLVGKWLAANELDEAELESIGLKDCKVGDNKEAFSLEAMAVFGKLSMMDEPLLIVFDQLEGLGLEYNQNLLHSFGDALKELFTYVPNSLIILNLFPDRWDHFKDFFDGSVVGRISQGQIILNQPSKEELTRILILKAQVYGVDIHQLFTEEDIEDIVNQKSIREVLNRASHYYRFRTQDIPLPTIYQVKSFEDEVKDTLKSINEQVKTLRHDMKEIKSLLVASKPALIQATTQSQFVPPPLPVMSEVPVSTLIIEYIEKEKKQLEEAYDKMTVISDSDDVGKLSAITKAFNSILNTLEIDHLKLAQRRLPEHLLIKMPTQHCVIGFLHGSDIGFTSRIKNFNELLKTHAKIHFTLFRDQREPMITGKVGKSEIEQLNNAPNGQFIYMDKEDRITFELIDKLISDIQNRDFDVNWSQAIKTLESIMSHYWLIKIFR
ncbi:MAG: ATP-binding protein, partial [Thiomargarita sp.]|nr:ATP-binding protein [Thiomargarita sp.]